MIETIPKKESTAAVKVPIVEDEGLIAEEIQDRLTNRGCRVVGVRHNSRSGGSILCPASRQIADDYR